MRRPHTATGWGLAGVVAFAALSLLSGMVLSYAGQYEVAHAARVWPRYLLWLYPLTGDWLGGVAYGALILLPARSRSRWYSAGVLVLAVIVSGGAQGIHANDPDLSHLDWRGRFSIGAWPILSTALAGHLLWLVLEEVRRRAQPSDVVPMDESRETEAVASTGTTPPSGLTLVDSAVDESTDGPMEPVRRSPRPSAARVQRPSTTTARATSTPSIPEHIRSIMDAEKCSRSQAYKIHRQTMAAQS